MKLSFEYGHGLMDAELPDNTDVFIPGETIPDPPHLPEDLIEEMTLKSIRNPIGMPPLPELVKKGSKVTIIFPDRVKGGEQETAHRKVSIKLILQELYSVGVEKKDILFICSNGLHRKNTEREIRNILGKDIYHEFWFSNQIINHDSEDYENLVDLGSTESGDPVIMNKYVYDSDIAILIGHTQGNPYGGYSGGYKHCATGITHWKSIASHHVPKVMHRQDFVPVSTKSLMRTKFDEIGEHMEKCMGKKFFCCDAVLDTKSRQIEINSGYAKEMQPLSWETANKRTFVPFAEKKYDVLVFGMPQSFHYGDGMGTNPIMLMQAISAQVVRHRRIMSDNCVIICSSICNGNFHAENWPYLEELYDMFQKDSMNTLPDLNRYGQYFATNEEYIRKYRYGYAYHPFHGFSMISSAHIAEKQTAAVYLVGAEQPGYARGMGLKTRATFEEALEDAKRKFVGENPNILALPKAFKTAAVHLMMKDEEFNGEELHHHHH
ncbi:lactate racemase domain-containing protein [Neobacillus cucumis]|uniref:lactate racemase domain-containing protein n=1 Tax=Neobacillus cucumis TaxID=1740721 RepID=UPI002E2114B9|nr:lactate racemase domain-containing protein [Neobacillus cucumis]MED4224484.1 lactate racemase domain-containing protein [Neobacillus cucumis]